MTGLDFELFVIGMLLYGLVFLVIAAVRRPYEAPTIDADRHDALISVTRGTGRPSTVRTRDRIRRAT